MKNSILTPTVQYLIQEKMLRNKIGIRTIKQCARQHEVSSNPAKLLHFNESKIQKKALLQVPKNQRIIYCAKKYCTLQENKTSLMDFAVVTSPSLFKYAKVALLNFFSVKNLDEEFDMDEFIENTKKALEVVTKLLSQSRFSHLDGLLTSECKAEVEKNVKALQPGQRYGLAVQEKDIINSFPYDLDIITDSASGNKQFLQITVVHHAWKNFSQGMDRASFEKLLTQTELLTIYNCRFIKECTKGVNSCWIINAINLYKLSEHLMSTNDRF